jgi:hypothetical protein
MFKGIGTKRIKIAKSFIQADQMSTVLMNNQQPFVWLASEITLLESYPELEMRFTKVGKPSEYAQKSSICPIGQL